MHVDVHTMDGQSNRMVDMTRAARNPIHIGSAEEDNFDSFDEKFDFLLNSSFNVPVEALKFARRSADGVLAIPKEISDMILNLALQGKAYAMGLQDWLDSGNAVLVSRNKDFSSHGWYNIEKV